MKVRMFVAALAIAAFGVPTAFAADASSCKPRGYCGQAGVAQTEINEVSDVEAVETLPFTGVQLGLAFVGGAALIAGGAAMRRAARQKE